MKRFNRAKYKTVNAVDLVIGSTVNYFDGRDFHEYKVEDKQVGEDSVTVMLNPVGTATPRQFTVALDRGFSVRQ